MIIFIVIFIFIKVKIIIYDDFQHHLRRGTPKCSQWLTPASRWLKTTIYQPWKITCKLYQYLTSNDMTLMCWNMWQNSWNMWQTYFYVTNFENIWQHMTSNNLKIFDNIWHMTSIWKYMKTYEKHMKTYVIWHFQLSWWEPARANGVVQVSKSPLKFGSDWVLYYTIPVKITGWFI